MMRSNVKVYARFALVFGVLAVLGIGGFVYALVNQRLRLPGQDFYSVKVAFSAADGVVSGVGQPVEVVGVPVGQITGARLEDGVAIVTLQIERDQLRNVYENATAALRPTTPLGDSRIDLDPGGRPARPLGPDGMIGLAATSSPVPLRDLLSRLDVDTRDYLSALLAAVGRGTEDRGPDTQRFLRALGPTVRQVGEISRALDARRVALGQFVHDLADVTQAASQDGKLSLVVAAGGQTLRAVAEQDRPLRAAISKLPRTLDAAQSTLDGLRPFTDELVPTLTELRPAVRQLPAALQALGRLADTGTPVLRDDLGPLVTRARPLLRNVRPTVDNLVRATPPLTGAAQALNYFLNELGYVPSVADPGFLFWTVWGLHNTASAFSLGDANGSILRALILSDCGTVVADPTAEKVLDLFGLCPR
jgi:virulence factor Mce-like protein